MSGFLTRQMSGFSATYRRELGAYFATPMAYVFLAVFLLAPFGGRVVELELEVRAAGSQGPDSEQSEELLHLPTPCAAWIGAARMYCHIPPASPLVGRNSLSG